MKKLILLTFSLLAVIVLGITPVVSSSVSADADGTRGVLSAVLNKYIQNIDDHRFPEAYLMTDQRFQEIIPQEAFVEYFNKLKCSPSLKYEVGSVTVLSDNKAELNISFKEPSIILSNMTSSKSTFRFTKEGVDWKLCLDWNQFYSTKTDLLPPLAEFVKDGVIATLKYIVLYPNTNDTEAYTHVRIDIKNKSGRQLCWQLPIPGTPEGYLKDPFSGRKFYPSHAYGILAKRSQDFVYIPSKYGSGTMLIGNNAEATLYIHITEIIPNNIKELSLFLDGLSFSDDNEDWAIIINNAPSHFEIVPNQ